MSTTFLQFLVEKANFKEIGFDKTPKIGWWRDNEYLYMYHGTHERNLDAIKELGLSRKDPKTGMISMALEPYTAHGYAAMSGSGGERNFRAAGAKPQHTPQEQRIVLKYKIPMSWIEKHLDNDFRGNIDSTREKLLDKKYYEDWVKKNGTNRDAEYYGHTELRFNVAIPSEFLVGYSYKVKK